MKLELTAPVQVKVQPDSQQRSIMPPFKGLPASTGNTPTDHGRPCQTGPEGPMKRLQAMLNFDIFPFSVHT